MLKVVLFGTHPHQYNGYSKVVYELTRRLGMFDDIKLYVYGFQRFVNIPNHRGDIPASVEIYDAASKEDPKAQGFGFNDVRDYIKEVQPDIVIIYNDMMVLTTILNQLRLSKTEDKIEFKTIAYIDQVYLCQKKEFIKFVNENADYAMLFTKYWEDTIIEQGITIPTGYLQHGFSKDMFFPIPKHIARAYFNLNPDDFILMNLNRNQPRKRWDTCLKAFAEIVSRYPKEPIKLLIGTSQKGAWDLIDIFERELKKRNVEIQDGLKHLIFIDRPQGIDDTGINVLYNCADIGINTCDGEGFGLCNFEQAALGIPQIVPNLGGFMDFFSTDRAELINPKIAFYIDSTRDAVAGEALMCDYNDFVEAIERYYFDKTLRETHGSACREYIIKNYSWDDITLKLRDICYNVCKTTVPTSKTLNVMDEVERLDVIPEDRQVQSEINASSIPSIKENKRKKLKGNMKEIIKLQKKLARLISNDASPN
jgi:glycosyltransferase involved in cell wall biosynthesis